MVVTVVPMRQGTEGLRSGREGTEPEQSRAAGFCLGRLRGGPRAPRHPVHESERGLPKPHAPGPCSHTC